MPKPDKESVREEDDRTVPPDDTDRKPRAKHQQAALSKTEADWTGVPQGKKA